MVDFLAAMKAIKEGKKIYRNYVLDEKDKPTKDPNWYAFEETPNRKTMSGFYDLNEDEASDCLFTLDNIEATDWKIYDEEGNWNLSEVIHKRSKYSKDVELAVMHEELKKKVIGDITLVILEKVLQGKHDSVTLDEVEKIVKKRFGF